MDRQTDNEAAAREWLASYIDRASHPEEIRTVTEHLDALILQQVPQVAADPALVAQLHASTAAHLRVFLGELLGGEPTLVLPAQVVDLAVALARRQIDLGVLLKVYRVAHQTVWDYSKGLIAELADAPRAAALTILWEHGAARIDNSIEQLITVYTTERDAAMEGMVARRMATIQAVLAQESASADVVSRDIGYQVRGTHVGLVLWAHGDPTDETPAKIDAYARQISDRLCVDRPLVVSASRTELWAWLAVPTGFDPGALRQAMLPLAVDRQLRVTAGSPASGLNGFRRTHRQARAAQNLVIDARSAATFTDYADVELVSFLAADKENAEALVNRELGALRGRDAASCRIRETLACYVAHGGNVEATAAALTVHKNTVRYRLAQAEQALAHPLTERRTDLDVALRYVNWYGCTDELAHR